MSVQGSPSFRLTKKLKEIKRLLKAWNMECFGRVELNKRQVLSQLEAWDQVEEETELSKEEAEAKKEAKDAFRKWASLEKIHWRQKSREIWLREGDRNTSFFHQMANSHFRKNSLANIKINGVWLTKD